MIVWSAVEPERVGEVALLDPSDGLVVLGRGETGDEPRAAFVRQRPGKSEVRPVLGGPGLSRRQLLLRPASDRTIHLRRVGRCPVTLHGRHIDEAEVVEGDVIELDHQLSLLCTARPLRLAELDAYPDGAMRRFGEPDAHGIVGEAPVTWELRERLAFASLANQHVLLLGESGVGKELAAHAIHAMSPRASRPIVTRNAATMPPGILDAELFGNVRDYPNAGMRERAGLIGEADGSTLFLDEIGEMPPDLQAHLLRVVDAGGEYQRLGDARTRRANIRLVVATNRSPGELKHDLLARLTLQLTVPPLRERSEDIPMLLRYVALRAAQQAPRLGDRFIQGWDGRTGAPRIAQRLVTRLLSFPCEHNMRDVNQLLWKALSSSKGSVIEDTAEVRAAHPAPAPQRVDSVPPPEPTAEQIRDALEVSEGNVTRAAVKLGLPSRYALYRYMRKHGIERAPKSGGSNPG